MRDEKKYLVDEIKEYLGKSEYFFVADYNRITVAETAELRASLAPLDAEFHVVKNSILKVALADCEYPEIDDMLTGPTAIVLGGDNAPGVAKALEKFFDSKNKVKVKGGMLEQKTLNVEEVGALAKLPPADVLKAQFLSLLNTPATQFARIVQAVPQGLLNVLQAKVDQENG